VVSWNPNFPEVLGNEWLANVGRSGRVWSGAPPLMARIPSTVAETITALKMSAQVNPLTEASIPTIVDVYEAGAEVMPNFSVAKLNPTSDKLNDGWLTSDGALTTNLYQRIDDDVQRWHPGAPAEADWIYSTAGSHINYECTFNVAQFAAAGAQQNARIGFVELRTIAGASTGYRKLYTRLNINGTHYGPAGGSVRDVHGYGAMYTHWWGELNPATDRPWTPADIAQFGVGGNSSARFTTYTTNLFQFPKIWGVRLYVYYITTENRVAVGVYRRPEDIGASRLVNIQTDTLRTYPAGTANWAKAASKLYLFHWRQSISPASYGPTVADDIRWNYLFQHLGPEGHPPGSGFPPNAFLALGYNNVDQFGRPEGAFTHDSRSSAGIAFLRSDAANSVDSQPYRLDITDLTKLTSAQKVGQRVTPASGQTYLGVRFPIMPPATGNPTLTAAVHRVSDGVQMGGSFSITAEEVRDLPEAWGGWRYVNRYLSSGAALLASTAYEIRLTSTAGGDWLTAILDSSLAPTTGFGGTTDGAFIGTTHFPNRELTVTLTRQPNAPTGLTAAIYHVPVTTYTDCPVSSIQHVKLTWTIPGSGMGAVFAQYELERQLNGVSGWHRVANALSPSTNTFVDHEVPRNASAQYRVRAVGKDGRFSTWNTSGSVIPVTTAAVAILTSNHLPTIEQVYVYGLDSSFPVYGASADETISIHGADYQVVFMETEDRGVGWRTSVKVSRFKESGLGGHDTARPLIDLSRSLDIPYVCAMDNFGTQVRGHLAVGEVALQQPGDRYDAQIEMIPTHTKPVPVTLS
jgi:hypothetical protein